VAGRGFRDLLVWQKAKDLAVLVYKLSNAGELGRDFGLRDQMRRAAVSVPSNLAEGDERETDKEAVRFFYMAKGSLAELRTQIQIAHEIGYLEQESSKALDDRCIEIAKMLGSLIKARSNPKAQSP
jgi:four helix bundle protein